MGGRVSERRGSVVPIERIESRILLVRGDKVLLDADLATLYGVQTRRLNEQVRRNLARFPADFMFQLTDAEFELLMSQFATSNPGRGGRRKRPLVFTEHGALMAATVLNSARAVEVSLYVVRAFVRHPLSAASGVRSHPRAHARARARQAPADRVRRSRREEARLGQ